LAGMTDESNILADRPPANIKDKNQMTRDFNVPIIGIDRGASCTDFAVVDPDGLIEISSIENRDWESIRTAYERLITKYETRHIVFSGPATGMPTSMTNTITIIAEIDAIGFGGAALANLSQCVVVSVGTGSAIVHFTNNSAEHLGGSGVGGGTIKGLSALICGLDNPSQIESLALKGNASELNLTISDLGYEQISFLGADMTASNFAEIKSKKIEDQAAAILDLVGETVGIIASICARSVDCSDHIVMVGKVAENRFIRQVLNLVGKLYQTTFIFPDNPGYATAYGATVKYRYDMNEKANIERNS
jgi:type II pantothenate kinase